MWYKKWMIWYFFLRKNEIDNVIKCEEIYYNVGECMVG